MPQIVVIAQGPDAEEEVCYRETIVVDELGSDHYTGQLVERLGWAFMDASEVEATTCAGNGTASARPSGRSAASTRTDPPG